MNPISVHIDADTPYEAAATVLSVLAWPEEIGSRNRLEDYRNCICQMFLTARSAVDPAWAKAPQVIKPQHLIQRPAAVEKAERGLQRRLPLRAAAARMAVPFVREQLGMPQRLPKGMPRLSLNEMASLIVTEIDEKRDTGETNADNIEPRVWRPSIPVIHIATALAVVSEGAEREGRIGVAGELYQHPDLLEEVVLTSQALANIMPMIRRFRIPSDKLIRLALA